MATVADIMTPNPRIVGSDESARRVAQVLAEEDIGGVIVSDDHHTVAGMVTDRDLAVGIVAEGRDPDTSVGELLSGRSVVTVEADDSLDRAVEAMKQAAVRRLPVMRGDEVVGIISQADLATHYNDEQVGDLVASISEAPDNTNRG